MNTTTTSGLAFGMVVCGLCGCAAAGPGVDDKMASASTAAVAASASSVPAAPTAPPAARAVTVQGQVMSAPYAMISNAQVSWLPSDPYLVPMRTTQTDAQGSFALGGVDGDARDWFVIQQTGYQSLFQAFDLTSDAHQTVAAATLLASADAAALAQSFGITLDPTRIVIRIPVIVAATDGAQPAAAGQVTVTTQPPLDVPVQYTSSEAIVFNAIPTDSYQVTVTRGASTCVPASHPAWVASDGSVEVRTLSGFWTVGATMVCP